MHFERPLYDSNAALLWKTRAGVCVLAFILFYASYPCAATQSQVITTFSEIQQKTMQIGSSLRPRLLCEYLEVAHQDEQWVAQFFR